MKNPKVHIESQGLAENIATANNSSWAAATLIQWCKEKQYPVFKLPLAAVDLSSCPWDVNDMWAFIYHAKRVNNCDLKYPVILNDKGAVCDGWHRIAKAILAGKTEIDVIRIEEMPEPDGYINN